MIRTTVGVLLLVAVTSLLAAGDGWVRDGAGVLETQQRIYLENLLQSVQQQTTAEVMVMTVPSLEGMDVDSYATRMFNQIGIGRSDTHNGVLFLIAPTERRTRIEVGYGLEPLITDATAGNILDNHVIPHFRSNQIAAGITEGTEAIAQLLQQHPAAAQGIPGSAPQYLSTRRGDVVNALWAVAAVTLGLFIMLFVVRRKKAYPRVLMFVVSLLSIGVVAIAVVAWLALDSSAVLPIPEAVLAGITLVAGQFMNLRLFRRFRPRYCESCSGPMRLLSETEDDQHLNNVQQLEERLGSVDYDVWFCPACLSHDTDRYVAFFSSYKACPKCQAQTLRENRTTLVRATRSHGGKVRVDGHCKSCQHKTTRIEHTPRISSSSGSSGSGGGSSGGGRSGGGGASRSW